MTEQLTYERYYDIAYAKHRIMNPLPERALPLFADLSGLGPGSRVLDIGSGKGYAPLAITTHCGAHTTQIDISRTWTEHARALFRDAGLSAKADIQTLDAREFSIEPDTYDMILCLGNSPIYGGFHEAVETFLPGLKSGGTMLMGEATLRESIPMEYQTYLEELEWMIPSENELILSLEEHNLDLLYARRSTAEEWDEYMGLQWAEVHRYIREHESDEPDGFLDELRDWLFDEQESYLRFQRHYMDWTVFLLQKP